MENKQKLELTWIGKGDEPKIEPRILIQDKEKSYGDENTENMLIHGDNLLALKALEQQYAGQVKCIYIDPPYNTGSAFEHYDDNLEHSTWLKLMYSRLLVLKNLLSDDGVIAIQIDDNEMPYLRVIMDEIFLRSRFVAQVNVKSNSISGAKTAHKEKTILRNKDNIIIYKKGDVIQVAPQYIKRDEWDTHYNYYLEYNQNNQPVSIRKLKDILIESELIAKNQTIKKDIIGNDAFYSFIIEHQKNIFRLVNSISSEAKKRSNDNPNEIVVYDDNNGNPRYAYNGSRISLLESSIISIDNNDCFAQLLGDLWTDIDFQNTQNEGGISFPNSKKPEALIKRILSLFTKENDLVLDSFLGSGTTAAVAHKMGRRWIGVELGEHCYTHCIPRLQKVVDGEQGGISKAVNWQGGGGFKFYELAPSLLKQDKYGNWIIDKDIYNSDMLAAAVAKLNGYEYAPDEKDFWKQGHSHGNSFIFTTTQYITAEYIDKLSKEIDFDQSLLICCPAFDVKLNDRYDNITIKKIPKSVLDKCEYGKDNYNLNIVEVPEFDGEDFDDE